MSHRVEPIAINIMMDALCTIQHNLAGPRGPYALAGPRHGPLVLAALATTARADFVNGGFEAGDLTGFTSIGTAAAVTDSVGVTPAAGTFQALLQTGQTAAGDPIGTRRPTWRPSWA